MIELADLFFLQQSFDDAAKWYADFVLLYPGNKQVEYASYRAVICASKNILGPDRDQSPTEKTLELAQTFLKREDLFAQYKDEVKKIERECYQMLAASDMRVAEFYISKKHDYTSAKKRIATIRDEWLEKAPEIGVELARLEVTLAELCTDFKAPEESIKLAQAVMPAQKKNSMVARF
jgi:outer membrane assembly lipoprotein YfiO